ncbi:MAG: hypothetical protein AB8B85_05885 [Paracoccaceae bacterium]
MILPTSRCCAAQTPAGQWDGRYHVYLATRPVDFRKGHAGLSLVVLSVVL